MNLYTLTLKSHHVFRWTGNPVSGHRRTISQHHAEVFATCIDLINKLKIDKNYINWEWLSKYAMFHDISEVFTGDIPYMVKKDFPDLKLASDEFEEYLINKIGLDMNKNHIGKIDQFIIKLLVKCADMIVVYRELKEYDDPNTRFIMQEMATNVFKKFEELIGDEYCQSVFNQLRQELFINSFKEGKLNGQITL